MGISAKVENKNILLGNSALLEKFVVPFIPDTNDSVIMYIDLKYSGSSLRILLKRCVKCNDLQALGLKHCNAYRRQKRHC